MSQEELAKLNENMSDIQAFIEREEMVRKKCDEID